MQTTYTRELGTAVTALGSSSTLLDVQSTELTARSLDDAGEVGGGVVARFSMSALPLYLYNFELVSGRRNSKIGGVKHTGCGGGR